VEPPRLLNRAAHPAAEWPGASYRQLADGERGGHSQHWAATRPQRLTVSALSRGRAVAELWRAAHRQPGLLLAPRVRQVDGQSYVTAR